MTRHNGTGEVTRRKGVGKHARGGALESWGGIVSGRVTDYAEATGTSPEAVLRAAEEVELVFDTAEPKGRGKDRDHPTDPGLRCLAMTAESARRLVETARENGGASSETR